MPENNVIAIDFGTSRTKLAYFDPKREQVVLMRHGAANYLPSYFAVDENEDILVGYAAQRMFASKHNRRRVVSNIKGKGQISELSIQFGPFRKNKKTPSELLTALFTHLKKAVNQQNIFESPPERVYLTHPSTFTSEERTILGASAQAAGFSFELIEEPIAAAQFVSMSEADLPTDLIVLDCGAGTLQWTYLHQQYIYRDKPKYIPEGGESDKLKAGGTRDVGGSNIEVSLAHTLQSQLGSRMKGGARMTEDDFEFLCHQAKLRKETFCRNPNDEPPPIEIEENFSVRLRAGDIESAIENHYITPACNAVEPYINNVVEETGRKPALVLTGGCAHIKNFATALHQKFGFDCITVDDFEYATVRGAIPFSGQPQPQQNERIETPTSESKPPEYQVIPNIKEAAERIGKEIGDTIANDIRSRLNIEEAFDRTGKEIGDTIANDIRSLLIRLTSGSKWEDLDIGGDEDTYMFDWDLGRTRYFGTSLIKSNIVSYFVENLSETLDKKIDDELEEIIGDLFSSSGVDLFSRSGEMLLQSILSETSVQFKEVVKQTVASHIDKILTEIDIEKEVKIVVKARQVARMITSPIGWIPFGTKKWRVERRKLHVKSNIRAELESRLKLSEDTGKAHIRDAVVKVFRATAEKLCQSVYD